MNILDFPAMKARKEKISMVTCYDYWSAELLEKTDIDMLLVGDSLAMVMHGFPSTVHATIELMEMHSAAVRRGAPKSAFSNRSKRSLPTRFCPAVAHSPD